MIKFATFMALIYGLMTSRFSMLISVHFTIEQQAIMMAFRITLMTFIVLFPIKMGCVYWVL